MRFCIILHFYDFLFVCFVTALFICVFLLCWNYSDRLNIKFWLCQNNVEDSIQRFNVVLYFCASTFLVISHIVVLIKYYSF